MEKTEQKQENRQTGYEFCPYFKGNKTGLRQRITKEAHDSLVWSLRATPHIALLLVLSWCLTGLPLIRIPPLSPPLPGNSNATSSRNLFWSFLLSNSLPHTIHFTLHSYLHICILPTRLLSSWRGRFSTPLSLPYTLNQLKFKKRIKKLFPPVWLMPLLALTIS